MSSTAKNVKLLTPVAMVDNFAEKIDECLLNRGCYVLFVCNWDREKCLPYRVAGCPLFRGFQCVDVYGETIGTFRIVRYVVGVNCSGVSVKRGSTVMHMCLINDAVYQEGSMHPA